MLYTSDTSTDGHNYQYAAGDGGCTHSANRTVTPLITVYETPSRRSYHNNRYFALRC